MRKPAIVLATALLVGAHAAGCGGDGGEGAAGAARARGPAVASGGEAVEVLRHAYYPREVAENYWETIPLAEAGPRFLLVIHPRIRTPAEGPWNITFFDPEGTEVARHENLRVDTATGAFTFLCEASRFAPGDWTILLVVPEGGMVAGPPEREYRFRIQ